MKERFLLDPGIVFLNHGSYGACPKPVFDVWQGWQREIEGLLSNGFKMEVESLITKDISYVTEEYVPQRLKAKDWLE